MKKKVYTGKEAVEKAGEKVQSNPLVLFPMYPFDTTKKSQFLERQKAKELETSLRQLAPEIFTDDTYDPKELGAILRDEFGIQNIEKLSMVEVLYLLKHRKTKALIWKILKIIGAVIAFIGIIVGILAGLHELGWL